MVTARPTGKGYGRRSDLALDILDSLGRVGTQRALRRVHEQDLIFLLPYLLTHDLEQLVICEAQWLHVDGLSDLTAVAGLAGLDLILHIGEPPSPAVEAWLRTQNTSTADAHVLTATMAAAPEDATPCPWQPAVLISGASTCSAHNSPADCLMTSLQQHLRCGLEPHLARTVLCDVMDISTPLQRHELRWAFGRDSARAAVGVLHDLHGLTARQIAVLTVDDVTATGALVGQPPAPRSAELAIARQRIYAQLIGQNVQQHPLITIDGSRPDEGHILGLLAGLR